MGKLGAGAVGKLGAGPANGMPQWGQLISCPFFVSQAATMDVMNLIEQPIKVTEWQQTYTYDSGIHSGANTCVPSISSKGVMDEEEACGRQYTVKKTTTYTQGVPQSQGREPRAPFLGNTPAEYWALQGCRGRRRWTLGPPSLKEEAQLP